MAKQKPKAKPQQPSDLSRWKAEIELYDRETQSWSNKSKRIVKRYKDERSDSNENSSHYNVLWSNVQTLLPALYARNPKPDIQRRYKDADPIGRVTSDVLERSVSYFCDTDLFAATIRQSVLDYLLPGRGTVWARYVPHLRKSDVEVTDEEPEGEEDNSPEEVDYEEVLIDYVNPEDYGHNVCRTWEEVFLVWRKVYLTRAELVERFGSEKGLLPPLDYRPTDLKGKTEDSGVAKAVIFELWDSKKKIAVWLHKTINEPLDLRDDPLELENFFPCPKPLFANLANDSLVPTPDYVEYQDQALELDTLTARIASITKSLKVAGVYDASAQGIQRLLSEGTENELIPVEQWAIFAEKGGLDGAISFMPLKDIASALMELYQAREQVKNDLYEITGMSDVIRGASDPQETATAQAIKVSFASSRLSDRQREVQRFVRATVRIMTDIICNHFALDTIKQISGVQLLGAQEKQALSQPPQPGMPPPQLPPNVSQDQMETMLSNPSWEDVEKLLRNNALRCFRIDIETDSTIKSDETQDRQDRIDFLGAVAGFIKEAIQAPPELAPFMGQALQFGVRGFPVGKELEGSLNVAIQKLEKNAQNPQQKPDPEMEKIQGELQVEQMKAQMQQQTEAAKLQAQTQNDQARNVLEAERDKARVASEGQIETMKMQHEGELQLRLAHIESLRAIEVARINAKATLGQFEEAREITMADTGASPLHPDVVKNEVSQLAEAVKALAGVAQQHSQAIQQQGQAMQQVAQQGAQAHAQTMQAIGSMANQSAQMHLHNQKNHAETMGALTSEKELVRDPTTGKATGVRLKQKSSRKSAN